MDAQQYYIRGIAAVKQGDMVAGRKLLLQSLKLNQNNDKAWLWVSRTIAEPDKKLECVNRALNINPNNRDALKLKQQLQSTPSAKQKKTTNSADRQGIQRLMREAETLVKTNRQPEAVDKWIMVLDIQHDHEDAMKLAVEYLIARDMMDDVKLLLYNAVDKGTDNAMILLSARDLAKTENTMARYDELNDMISQAPWATPKQILRIANAYAKDEVYDHAIQILQSGLKTHSDDPELLNLMAQIHEMTGREALALQYYERVANSAVRSKLGKEADKRLSQGVPIMSDAERGSSWLAWREVFGIFMFFFLLAFMDSGLNLVTMGAGRWMGVMLSLVGSYLLVTATSSPQQHPLASILGGHLPENNPKIPERRLNPMASLFTSIGIPIDEENHYVGPIHEPSRLPIIPEWIRWVFGISGSLMLIFAFYLVLATAIGLVGLSDINLDPQFWEAIGQITS